MNGTDIISYFSATELLVCIKAIDLSVLILYLATLPNCLVSFQQSPSEVFWSHI